MKNTEHLLLNLLKTIEGNGSFATTGVKNFTFPGLQIEGIGEIGFPLNAIQAAEIRLVSHQAPYGKGSQTITDTTVRSTREIDADQLSFKNAGWKTTVDDILAEVKIGLGMPDVAISASLYKLLIYEPGDFFLPHKDSEKEPGMFGTLSIGLPSAHAGGELAIRFDGREKIVDFSAAASNYQMPFVAFFADCEHEIRPVRAGFRVCLVYNLLQPTGAQKVESPQFSRQTNDLADLLRSMENSVGSTPKVVLLGHQYTPANFSRAALKGHDKPRAAALLAAAEMAGFHARLGLLTHHIEGELEGGGYDDYYSSRRGRRGDSAPEPAVSTMGEIYEETISIDYWAADTGPGLGEINLEAGDLITEISLGEGDPIEQEEEGYTGNAGMTLDYWYHFGAVILWPKSSHQRFLGAASLSIRLDWLDFYGKNWETAAPESQRQARELLFDSNATRAEEIKNSPSDFTPAAVVLSKMDDEKFLLNECGDWLPVVFHRIKPAGWAELLKKYQSENAASFFKKVFQKAAARREIEVVNHQLDILATLTAMPEKSLASFVSEQIGKLPGWLEKVELENLNDDSSREKAARKTTITAIVEKLLPLSQRRAADAGWTKKALAAMTRSLPRNYVNGVLTAVLLAKQSENSPLARELQAICIRELAARVAVKPVPLPNWTREMPKSASYHKAIWVMLADFLASPTQRVFDYRQSQSLRSDMESAIKNVVIDLKMETIKQGSPHTLRLTKTEAAFERSLAEWAEDGRLLEAMKGWANG